MGFNFIFQYLFVKSYLLFSSGGVIIGSFFYSTRCILRLILFVMIKCELGGRRTQLTLDTADMFQPPLVRGLQQLLE